MRPTNTLPILTLSAAALLLTGCGQKPLDVTPAEPLPPPCLTVPKSILEPIPGVFISPQPKPIRSAGMKCVPQLVRAGREG